MTWLIVSLMASALINIALLATIITIYSAGKMSDKQILLHAKRLDNELLFYRRKIHFLERGSQKNVNN